MRTATALVVAASLFSTTAFAQSMGQQAAWQQQQDAAWQQQQLQQQQLQVQQQQLEQQQRMMRQQQQQHDEMMRQNRQSTSNQPNGMVCSGGTCARSGADPGYFLSRAAEQIRQNKNR